tara:strand:+ start:290 stop:508 length:219 start_codon:yes stop_codon:yes gene_type:complete
MNLHNTRYGATGYSGFTVSGLTKNVEKLKLLLIEQTNNFTIVTEASIDTKVRLEYAEMDLAEALNDNVTSIN